jgi:DNA-binding transcriptional ArsR family regulator
MNQKEIRYEVLVEGDGQPGPLETERLAAICSALAHPARIAILRRLACCDACCCKDVVASLDLAQSTVSQHLKVLVEAGLVRYQPGRPRSRYTLDRAALVDFEDRLKPLLSVCRDDRRLAGEARRGYPS